MGIRSWIDRLRDRGSRPSGSSPSPLGDRRGTDEETVLVAPPQPAPAEPGQVQPAAVEPATAVVPPADETAIGIPPEPAQPPPSPTHTGPAAPAEGETVIGVVPPAAELREERSDVFPKPSPPPSIRPVPRTAAPHRLRSDEEIAGVLVGLSGPLHRMAFVIPRGRTRVGRASDCDLRLDDPGIQPSHVEFESAGSRTTVVASGATGRVEINGEPHASDRELADGDLLRLGESGASVFRYRQIEALDGPVPNSDSDPAPAGPAP